MLLIDGYPEGSNLTIMNVLYQYAKKDPETGKRSKDFAIIIYKDNNTGEKHATTIFEPEYTWYLVKEGRHPDPHYAEFDDVIPIKCKYSEVLKSIAKETGNIQIFNDNISDGNWKLNNRFFLNVRAYGADTNIKNYIRTEFAKTYLNPVIPLDIFFFDIESDIINAVSDNVIIGECPVVLISGYYTKTNTLYIYILRNPKNPQIAEFENKVSNDFELFKKEVHQYIAEQIKENTEKFASISTPEISIGFFDKELEMIITFYDMLNKLSPDLVTAWNGFTYDFLQLFERARELGLDPIHFVPDPRITPSFCNIVTDQQHRNKPEERTDYGDISTLYTIVDDMIIYASRRKGQGAIESTALDYVGGLEAKVHKFDYHEITTNIAKFPWLNFYLFVIYNILDVMCQVCIEIVTEDIKFMFNNVIEMNTPYEKIWRQTNFLATKGKEFYEMHENVIMGNNRNRFGEKPKEKFPGAFVADPSLVSDKNKTLANGKYISKYNNSDDWDYKALYPSLLREFNMSPSTQIGMIQIEDSPYKDPDYLKVAPGGTFLENLASYNYIEFCHRWLNMADIEQVLEDLDEYFSTYRTPMYKGQGNLPFDKQFKVIAYRKDKKRIVSVKRPMPQWIKERINQIRSNIPLK